MNVPARPFAPIAAPPESLPTSIPALLDDLWSRIENGLDGRWRPWALPILATHSPGGARARVLALRSVDRNSRRFVFHTDARSAKVRELESDANVSLLFWDPSDAIEARFGGVADVHRRDDIARTAWQNVSTLRRMASAISLSPGTALIAPERFDALGTAEADEVAFANFTVVYVTATDLDWLWLGPSDMRRAAVHWAHAGYSGSWVVP